MSTPSVGRIYAFWKKYGYYDTFDRETIEAAIQKHINYGTIEVVERYGEIIAIGRFNIYEKTVTILDVVIKPEYRNQRVMQLMLMRGWKRFPFVTRIRFERGLRNDDVREYDMVRFLNITKGVYV